MKGFLLGLGVVAAIMLLLYPSIKSRKQPRPQQAVPESDARRFERQASAAQDVTATEEEEDEPDERTVKRSRLSDEEISASKNYQPPDHWKWKYESEANDICEPLWDMPWEVVCHHRFERPVYRHDPPRRQPRQPQQRWVYGPPIRGPDGRMHRTRMAAGPGVSGPYGGCRSGEC
jgi:hypothetical protein